MKLGFVSAILPNQSLEEVLQTAAEVGYDNVEIMCWPAGKAERRYAGVCHIDVEDFDQAKADEVKGLLDQTGVGISGLGYYPNPLSPNAEESTTAVEQIKKVMHAAHLLGVKNVNSFIGRDWKLTIDQNWPRFLETWKPLVELAEQLDLKIGIENCPMLFSDDEWPGGKNMAICPAVWKRMFEDIPSPHFGLNYDPSHLVWQFIDPVEPIYEFGDRIFHVHAKDARVDWEKLHRVGILNLDWHTPKLPGMGDVDWGKFFGALTDIKYNGSVAVEVEDRAFEGSLEDRHRSLVQSFRFLHSFVV